MIIKEFVDIRRGKKLISVIKNKNVHYGYYLRTCNTINST